VELSKTVALTALLFIIVLIFTSAISFSAEGAAPKKKEANFERSGTDNVSVGADRYPTSRGAGRERPVPQCQYKPVMTEKDMQACKKAR